MAPATANAVNTALAALNAPGAARPQSAMGNLGEGDFLRLLTVQLSQQDPLEPVDNKDMLAQLAQFSALAGSTSANARLGEISEKLDALIAAQERAAALSLPQPTIS